MNAFDSYDETKAHEIVEGIYWVGFADRKAGFSNNPYVLDDGEDVILLDDSTVKTFANDGNSTTEKLIEGYAGLTAKIGCVMLANKIAGEHDITLPKL